jgi:hypothetical protein
MNFFHLSLTLQINGIQVTVFAKAERRGKHRETHGNFPDRRNVSAISGRITRLFALDADFQQAFVAYVRQQIPAPPAWDYL